MFQELDTHLNFSGTDSARPNHATVSAIMAALYKEHASGRDVLPHGSDLRSGRGDVESVNKQPAGMDFGLGNPESQNHPCSSEDTFL